MRGCDPSVKLPHHRSSNRACESRPARRSLMGDERAPELVLDLIAHLCRMRRGSDSAEPFAAAASGHTSGGTQNDGVVLAILDTPNRRRAVEGIPPEPNPAADAFKATMTGDERQRSGLHDGRDGPRGVRRPRLLAHSESSEISPADLLDSCGTLYLSATVREQRRLRPVFIALLEAVIEEAYNRVRASPVRPHASQIPVDCSRNCSTMSSSRRLSSSVQARSA